MVTEFTTISKWQFVRVHGPDNRERSWVMENTEIEGLNPDQIKDKFGSGGGTQYELLQRLDDPSVWQNTRKLGK